MSPRRREKLAFLAILLAGLAVPLGMPFLGPTPVGPADLLRPGFGDSPEGLVFFGLRVPRVLFGWAVGAALALSGMVFQAVFRNPMATPFTLGVSGGAAFGAALATWLGLSTLAPGWPAVPALAFAGALTTTLLVVALASGRQGVSTETMLLAGVAMSFCFSAAILLLQYLSRAADSFLIVRWLMGDLTTAGFARPAQVLVVLAVAGLVVGRHLLDLDLLLAGEDLAATRGVDVSRVRLRLFVAVSLLTGTVVALCGPIGFVGMMVPQLLRLVLGVSHRRLAVACLVGGGAFLTVCDGFARVVVAPAELPVGVLTSLLGGPFFLWLLIRRRGGGPGQAG